MKIFLMVISLLLLCSCDKFPSENIYRINHLYNVCELYKLNEKTVTIKFEKEIPFDDCPKNIYGFDEEDTAKVAAWIRREKRKHNK